MPVEPELIIRFVAYFIVAQFAIVWLMLPFAIFGTRKRMTELMKQYKEMISEVTRLRLTVETMPGATRIGRRPKGVEESALAGITQLATAGERVEPTVRLAEKHPADGDIEPTGVVHSDLSLHNAGPGSLLEDERLERFIPDDEDDYDEDYEDDTPEVVAAPVASTKKKAKKKLAIPQAQAEASEDTKQEKPSAQVRQPDMPDDGEAPESAANVPHKPSESIIVDIPEEDEISEDDAGYFSYRGERFEHLIDAMRQQQADAHEEQRKAV